jgi:hypothetical protein
MLVSYKYSINTVYKNCTRNERIGGWGLENQGVVLRSQKKPVPCIQGVRRWCICYVRCNETTSWRAKVKSEK